MPVQMINILNIIITMCEELVTAKKYDFKKVINEKIKVISSRFQCPIQKEQWKLHGASGKWEKAKEQKIKILFILQIMESVNYSYKTTQKQK